MTYFLWGGHFRFLALFALPAFVSCNGGCGGKTAEESVATAPPTAVPARSASTPVASKFDHLAVPQLLGNLESPDFETTMESAEALARQGDDAIPLLVQALADTRPERRIVAGYALRQLGPRGVGALVEVVNSGSAIARRAAVESLVHMGTSARDAVPTFIKALGSDDSFIRAAALYALTSFKGEPGVSAERIQPLLEDPAAAVRRQAVVTLEYLAGDAPEFRSRLKRLAETDADVQVKSVAKQTLERFENPAGSATRGSRP